MDPLTHMLTGALVDQGCTKKDFIKQATWIGVLSGSAADLDYFAHSKFNPLLNLEIHRSFTHSFIFILIGGLIMLAFFLLLNKTWLPRWKEVLGLATIAYGTHSFLDACTSYGTQLFWPFSHERVSWDILSIIDPAFTLILLTGVILAYRLRSPKAARWMIVASFCYIGFAIIQHHRAMHSQTTLQIERHHTQTLQNRVLPRLASLYDWDSLYINNGTVYLDTMYTPLGHAAYIEKNFSVPLFKLNVQEIQSYSLAEIKTFIWFTQNYTMAVSLKPLVLVDLRYVKKHKIPQSMWGIEWSDSDKLHPMKWRQAVSI